MSTLRCTTSNCDSEAERIIALRMAVVDSVFVAPYCVAHGDAIIREGRGLFAAGPALSEDAAKIEGVRR